VKRCKFSQNSITARRLKEKAKSVLKGALNRLKKTSDKTENEQSARKFKNKNQGWVIEKRG
jgi:hypothetical protein